MVLVMAEPPTARVRARWRSRRRHGRRQIPVVSLGAAISRGCAMDESVRQHKFVLEESEMPTTWYNLVPDLPSPPPPALHPGTLQPVGPEDFAPLFPMDLILQEVSQDRFVDIPGAVLDVYRQWRPSPLFRAHRLEQRLRTPAR